MHQGKQSVPLFFHIVMAFFLLVLNCFPVTSPDNPTENLTSAVATVNPVPGVSVWFYMGNNAITGRYPTLLTVFDTIAVFTKIDPYDTTRADPYTGGPGVVTYKGYIKISEDGNYIFSVISTSATQLTIHGQTTTSRDVLKLKEGFHDFTITISGDSAATQVHFLYGLNGNPLIPVPHTMLFHESEGENDRYNNFSRFFTPQKGSSYQVGDTLDIYFAANPDSLNSIYFSFSPDNGLKFSRITSSSNYYGYPNWGHALWVVPDSVSYYSTKISTMSPTCTMIMHNYGFDIITAMESTFTIRNKLLPEK